MREHKTRLWYKPSKIMIYPKKAKSDDDYDVLLTLDGKIGCMHGEDAWEEDVICYFDDETKDYVRMDYTGLKDKNQKEIYEGDIIIFDNTDIGGSKITGQVIFNTDCTLSNLEWGLWTKNGYHRTDFLGVSEIIGNVYENPELIK